MPEKKLFSDFSPVSTELWEEKIHTDLKGADYERKLITKTIENIRLKPYYRLSDLEGLEYLQVPPGQFPYVRTHRTKNGNFLIRQDFLVTDFSTSAEKAKVLISKGVESIGFDLKDKKNIRYEDLKTLLSKIHIEKTEINFLHGNKEILSHLIRYAEEIQANTKKINGSLNFDPIGEMASEGSTPPENIAEEIQTLFALSQEQLPHFKLLGISGYHFRNAGGSAVQELAFSLSQAVDYLEAATDAGINASDFASKIKFNFAAGSNYFMEIAKMRAARLLWANILKTFGVEEEHCRMYVHSSTCDWNKTAYDMYVNVLRTTTEGMSAILGGADSLTINPLDSALRSPDDFSERIARNIQILLKEESGFDKIIDPAAGSYYIENLTDSIIENSWSLFLETEKNGGFTDSFHKGNIKSSIETVAQKRDLYIAQRREILLGTNQYANLNEEIKDLELKSTPATDKTLRKYRGGEAFETLRQSTEKSGKRPKVFMFTMGNLAMRKARAGFSANFFACAGYEIIDNLGFATVEEGVKAWEKTQAEIVVICSSDDEYAEIAPPIFEQLKDKTIVVIAGYPKNSVEMLQQIGIKHFIHVKVNVLDTLQNFQKELNIQ
ncbi:MAG: methylmalonyl-CoA mutase small subunit [Bacteroidia bacterium]|nr:MAG: methylmalonyl-CoA mutase small subunit [Bacteroidia bacterium]